ncbi:MAG: carboxypeptidase regulatory-like domain-containing protein [Spirulina sp.]
MNYPVVLLLAGWGGLVTVAPAFAHGAKIEYQPINGIEIQARYDSGEPMSAAQVNVYAPDNPSEPWQTGTTDSEGRFVFTPDPSRPGNWEVMVRQAGHGDVLAIPVEGNPVAADAVTGDSATGTPEGTTGNAGVPGDTNPSAGRANAGEPRTAGVPLWVSMAAVVWGFVGTALFFARGKR